MAKLIKQIHDLVDLATDKGLTNYWSRTQIDTAVYAAVTSLFRELLPQYPKTKLARNFLHGFQKTASITLTAGIGDLPADFEHEVEPFVNDTDKTPIIVVERGYWNKRKLDPVDPPSATAPIGTIYLDTTWKIEVAPTSLTSPIKILYFKTPTMPVYTTVLTLGQEVYDDTTTVDVDDLALVHDIIFERALKPLGLSIKDGQVVSQAQVADVKLTKVT
jgi:hypothetical protein